MYCRTRKGLVTPGDQCTLNNIKQERTKNTLSTKSPRTSMARRAGGSFVMCLLKEVKEHDDINGTWRCTTTGENNLSKNCTSSSVDAWQHGSANKERGTQRESNNEDRDELQLRKRHCVKHCLDQDTRSTTTGKEKT